MLGPPNLTFWVGLSLLGLEGSKPMVAALAHETANKNNYQNWWTACGKRKNI